jgi:thiamine monophosphate synthase
MTTAEQTTVVSETLRQCRAQGISAKTWLTDPANMRLICHRKTSGYVVNTHIDYNPAVDLYNVTVYRIDMRLSVKGEFNPAYGDIIATREFTGVCAESLPDVVGVWKS